MSLEPTEEITTKEFLKKVQTLKREKIKKESIVSLSELRSPPLAINKKTILVVDDEAMIRNVIKRIFEREGYEVVLAQDALSLEECLDNKSIKLILLDIGLPWVDGFELCKLFKSHETFKDIPIIFISGKKFPEDIKTGFELGAVDFIKKPFTIDEIKETVSTVLRIQ